MQRPSSAVAIFRLTCFCRLSEIPQKEETGTEESACLAHDHSQAKSECCKQDFPIQTVSRGEQLSKVGGGRVHDRLRMLIPETPDRRSRI